MWNPSIMDGWMFYLFCNKLLFLIGQMMWLKDNCHTHIVLYFSLNIHETYLFTWGATHLRIMAPHHIIQLYNIYIFFLFFSFFFNFPMINIKGGPWLVHLESRGSLVSHFTKSIPCSNFIYHSLFFIIHFHLFS